MNTADIVARLKLSGESFSADLRTRFGEFDSVAAASAQKAAGEFRRIGANILPPADFQRLFAAGSQAADRMVASVDPLFAAQQRYNVSLREANELQQLGFLTGARYQQVHAGITRQLELELAVNQRLGTSMGQRRIGMQQLSFQAGDVAQQLAVGTSAAIVFAQQSGQVIQALQLMGGEGNAFLRFLGGPWGIALSAAAVVMAPLLGKLFDTRTELQKATQELEENARKADLNRQAQEIYARSLSGVIDAIRAQTEALQQQNRTVEQSEALALRQAAANAERVRGWRDAGQQFLAYIEQQAAAQERANQSLSGIDLAAGMLRLRELREQVAAARRGMDELNRQVQQADGNRRVADAARISREVNEGNDPRAAEAARLRREEALLLEQRRNLVWSEVEYRQKLDEARDASRRRTEQIERETAAQRRANNEAIAAERRAGRTLMRPVAGGWMSPFGADRSNVPLNGRRIPGRRHQAVDIGGTIGAPVVAPEGGQVSRVDTQPGGWGLFVEIRADSGARDVLAHLSGARVAPGDRVTAGQVIGLLGDSGNARGGLPHVHHERRDRNGRLVDPSRLYGTGASAAAQEANRGVAVAERELEARNQIVTAMATATAQSVEQARLGDLRLRTTAEESALETALSAKRQEAAERMRALQENLTRMRADPHANQADIASAEARVNAQQLVTNGLTEQLALYERQRAAYTQLVNLHRQDGKATEEEVAAAQAAAAAAQETLARAAQIRTTVADTLLFEEATVRAQHAQNQAMEDGETLREKERQHAQEMAEEQQRALDDMKQDMMRRQEDQVRDLADLYGDLFRGQTGSIIDRFKDGMLDAIAEIAAAWTLSQISGQQFNLGGTLQGMSGNPIAGLLSGLMGGGKGGGGAVDLLSMHEGFFGGGGAAGGAAGLLGSVGSVMPYAAAAFAAFGILKQLGVFSSTKRGSATLGFSGGELGAGATRGNNSGYIAASSSAMDSVGSSLERIAEALGGNVTGPGSVSLGQRDGNWRGDPSGRGITKTKKGAIDFGDDQEAAIRWAISEALRDGVISGISDAAKRILQSGKDLEKAIDKAMMIESIPKLLKARMDPVGAALDELEEKWAKVIAALKEGGATAEQMADAQKLYKLELEDTIAKTASASQSLKDFLDSLKMGSNSPYSLRDQEATARAALQPFLDKIAAGEAINNDQYQAAAQTYLDIERQLYGSTGQFFTAMDEVMAATTQAIARIDSAVPIRTAVDPFVEQTAANTTTMTEQLEVISGFLGTMAAGASNDNGTYTPTDFIGGGGGWTGTTFQ